MAGLDDGMTQLEAFANGVETRSVETVWIPLADGRRLAARLFLPANPAPVPVILEYIPYRRRDLTRLGDDQLHLWFAAHGYAGARVDIAGTGDSEGVMGDEYIAREQDDACEVIEWLGQQDWCSGAVGMIGHSWGGFSGLQAAARRPARLKAVVSVYSTDDRYACDAHWMGGCLIDDNFSWGSALFNYCALPPDPAVVGHDTWREMWRVRIENATLIPAGWMRHQRRDEFWKHGSVCEDFGAIACPVLAVGGWLDGYPRTVFNLVENLSAPCKGIIGPWGHKMPEIGFPGPAIGFLQECLRWWDRWLKDIKNGVEDDPDMRLYLMDPLTPDPVATTRPGRWLAIRNWPEAAAQPQTFSLGSDGTLVRGEAIKGAGKTCSVRSPLTTGQTGQAWCPYGQGRVAPDGAVDQRVDDALSLCFDLASLTEPLSILGTGWLRLLVSADKPLAQVAVRLTDVAPDGTSTLVSFGVLNLAHRNSHEFPEALVPGQSYDVQVELKPVGQIIPAGHKLRLAISSAYWPMLWPSPEQAMLTIDPAGSRLDLPVLAEGFESEPVIFGPVAQAPAGPSTRLIAGKQTRDRRVDVATGTMTLTALSDDGTARIDETGTEVSSSHLETMIIAPGVATSAEYLSECKIGFRRDDWQAHLQTTVRVTCSETAFHVTGSLVAHEGDQIFAERKFDETIPRDHL
ncbi:MAG: CocE/NonD family hydrolase [Cypionkella sp.]|uniref:CocE/NonD family hydrolase n=2 Tax=Cypionkella sp. TaxID=2811411 RepID=UPI002ABAED79|nr:CocE/NonD family hydrolase [Cypionkella sp.]MDZ4312946.1 CocE/NonD family hydrolase [Cypionkella sp.]MDZ4392509.1 CocE/NonD family hydrolase [Cypionkella sp.]